MPEWMIKYWVEWLFGIVCAGLTLAYRRMSAKAKQDRAVQQAVRLGVEALLDDRIVQLYKQYESQGYCPIDARRSLEKLYNAYHALGGNGTNTDLINKIKGFPTEPPEEEKV